MNHSLIFFLLLNFISPYSSVGQSDSIFSWRNYLLGVFYNPASIQGNHYWETHDGGKNWERQNIAKANEPESGFLLDFQSPCPMVFVSDSIWLIPGFDGTFDYSAAYFRTENAGLSWKYMSINSSAKSIGEGQFHVVSEDSLFLFLRHNYALSSDAGETWSLFPIPLKAKSFNYTFWPEFKDSHNGMMHYQHDSVFTTDGGFTWTKKEASKK